MTTVGEGAAAFTAHRGIRAEITVRDDPDHEGYVVIELYVDPPPPVLDRLSYTRHQKVEK